MNIYSVKFSLEYDRDGYGGETLHTRTEGVERKIVADNIVAAMNFAIQLVGSTFEYEFDSLSYAGKFKTATIVEITAIRKDGKGF